MGFGMLEVSTVSGYGANNHWGRHTSVVVFGKEIFYGQVSEQTRGQNIV
jgi:hypothetical protein